MESPYDKDRTHFLKIQIEQLTKLKHSLSQITFVVNDNPEEDDNYKQFVENLPDNINGTPLVVIRRENKGMMFGVWFHVCELYGTKFDYLLISEDDYAPASHHFDQTYLKAIKGKNNCGFLCPKTGSVNVKFFEDNYGPWPECLSKPEGRFRVPTCVIGLIPSRILCHLLKKHDDLLYSEENYNEIDQGLVFYAMNAEGYEIYEMGECKHIVLRNKSKTELRKLHHYGNGPVIFAPTQWIEQENK
jgi:hypothetical protein